jgi:hypothetical protein
MIDGGGGQVKLFEDLEMLVSQSSLHIKLCRIAPTQASQPPLRNNEVYLHKQTILFLLGKHLNETFVLIFKRASPKGTKFFSSEILMKCLALSAMVLAG